MISNVFMELFFLVYLNEVDYENYEIMIYKGGIFIRFVMNIDKINLCLLFDLVEGIRKEEILELKSYRCIFGMIVLVELVFF